MGLSSADIYETYNDDPRQMTVIGDLGDNVNEPGGLPAKNPEELVQAVPVVLGDSHRFYLTRDVYLTVEDESNEQRAQKWISNSLDGVSKLGEDHGVFVDHWHAKVIERAQNNCKAGRNENVT